MTITGYTGCDGDTGTIGFIKKLRKIIKVPLLNQLRIGNYIMYNNTIIRIDLGFFKTTFTKNQPEMEGIPITEDLLYSIGYYKQRNYDYDRDNDKEYETEPYFFHRNQIEFSDNYQPEGIFLRDNKFYVLGNSYPQLKYLHQLQNRFYNKTNEEIIINKKSLNLKK